MKNNTVKLNNGIMRQTIYKKIAVVITKSGFGIPIESKRVPFKDNKDLEKKLGARDSVLHTYTALDRVIYHNR